MLLSQQELCCIKDLQVHAMIFGSIPSQTQRSRLQIWTLPFCPWFYPLCPFLLPVCNPYLPSSHSRHPWGWGQVKAFPPHPHEGLKFCVQFQLSEADPLLLMALRGLRDMEPLFFQRTAKRKTVGDGQPGCWFIIKKKNQTNIWINFDT